MNLEEEIDDVLEDFQSFQDYYNIEDPDNGDEIQELKF